MITGKTKLLGIIGHPVEHSLSPAMQNAAIAHLGLDYIYLPFPVRPEDLSRALAGFEAIGLLGFNATIPHKQSLIPLLAKVSPTARQIGAVNTVWQGEAGWEGTNTDIDGFLAPLKKLPRDWRQITPGILGSGGAARAVVAACAELGCPEIHVFGRNQDRLAHFCQKWCDTRLKSLLIPHGWSDLPALVSARELLVNTTPIGMYPQVGESPLSSAALERLGENAIAYDLIYTPRPTLFLRQAARRGATTIDGAEMLVQQGAKALEIWLRQPAPVEVMRAALLNCLS